MLEYCYVANLQGLIGWVCFWINVDGGKRVELLCWSWIPHLCWISNSLDGWLFKSCFTGQQWRDSQIGSVWKIKLSVMGRGERKGARKSTEISSKCGLTDHFLFWWCHHILCCLMPRQLWPDPLVSWIHPLVCPLAHHWFFVWTLRFSFWLSGVVIYLYCRHLSGLILSPSSRLVRYKMHANINNIFSWSSDAGLPYTEDVSQLKSWSRSVVYTGQSQLLW